MSRIVLSDPILPDMQAHILKHHGREHAYHLFLVFKKNKISQVKTAIRKLAKNNITSAKKQLDDAFQRSIDSDFDGGTVVVFSLSKFGYDTLGVNRNFLADNSFKAAAKSRITFLDDKLDEWDFGFTFDIDALVVIADSDRSRLYDAVRKIHQAFNGIADIVVEQRGKVLRNGHGIGIEHFGYADGVSQPIYLDTEVDEQGDRTQWNDEADTSLLLVQDKNGQDNKSFGSYFVFRKLEQNVKAFNEAEEAIAASGAAKFLAHVKDDHGLVNDELAGAMIVGRFEDSSEVVNNSRDKGITQDWQMNNDFDYRDDKKGLKCPFHAHIRLTNPRSDIKTPGDAKKYRITRRGIPFNDIGRNENDLDNDQPSGGVGLLFQCYQSSIQGQFEVIQKFWANDGNIQDDPNKNIAIDGIIGQGPNTNAKTLPKRWNKAPGTNPVSFSGFVTNRGGEYFFTPSISSLKNL
jgi:Dyp-type peroxidase family